MADFKPDYLASALQGYLLWYISDDLPKNGGEKVRSIEFGDLESIVEAATWHLSEKVAVLQISEIATACKSTQISTPQRVFQRNFPYILNTLYLQNTFRRLLLSD